METIQSRGVDSILPKTPIPNFSLSAAGLVVLADLKTIPRRTALTGGSSWLDALVLAPGLHYQQAADEVDRQPLVDKLGQVFAVELGDLGSETRRAIKNLATVNYLKKLYQDGSADMLEFDISMLKSDGFWKTLRKLLGRKRKTGQDEDSSKTQPDMDQLSHVLYLATPLLTIIAIVFTVLLEDWWTLAFILSLILSRILNIWAIKQRCIPSTPPPNALTEYLIDLGLGRSIRLRGLHADLQAITTQAWIRAQSNLDGYLEAMAKLLVYLVAAFSGNSSQAGAIVLMALLLASAGLLGLSNAHAKEVSVYGRFARPFVEGGLKGGLRGEGGEMGCIIVQDVREQEEQGNQRIECEATDQPSHQTHEMV